MEKFKEKKRAEKYSKKEIETLQLLALGYSDAEIAAKLGNTKSAVRNIIMRLIIKSGTINRTHLVVRALREGFIK